VRTRGFVRTDATPLLVQADFDYEKRRNIYVFAEFDPEIEFEAILEDLEGKVLFPNVTPVSSLYRRCDGAWLSFKDAVTRYLVSGVCSTVMSGGYPPQFEYAVALLVERLNKIERRERIARIGFALAQAYATGALGEFSLSEFGYEINEGEIDEIDEINGKEENERLSLYAGKLALWEVGEEGEAPHVLCAHAFRRIYARSNSAEALDGRSVVNAIEYLCRLRQAKGHPHPVRGEVAYEIALMLESGELVFEDGTPDPFPHT